jgi:hypothetical protein
MLGGFGQGEGIPPPSVYRYKVCSAEVWGLTATVKKLWEKLWKSFEVTVKDPCGCQGGVASGVFL